MGSPMRMRMGSPIILKSHEWGLNRLGPGFSEMVLEQAGLKNQVKEDEAVLMYIRKAPVPTADKKNSSTPVPTADKNSSRIILSANVTQPSVQVSEHVSDCSHFGSSLPACSANVL